MSWQDKGQGDILLGVPYSDPSKVTTKKPSETLQRIRYIRVGNKLKTAKFLALFGLSFILPDHI